jgi:integrase
MMARKDERGWNLFRRGDGQWVLQYRTAPGNWSETRVPREHGAERAAEQYARVWLDEYTKQVAERPIVNKIADERPTIRDLAEKWLELRNKDPKLSAATRTQNASNMRRHVLAYPKIADAPIADLGSGALREWLREVRDHGRLKLRTTTKYDERPGRGGKWIKTGEPLAPYTTRNVVNTLSAFFNDAMAEQWVDLPANPMHHPGVRKEIPGAETRAGTVIYLSRPAVEKLLAAKTTPEHRRVRYLLAATSGLRDGEIAGLRFEDVDVDAGTVNVDKSLAEKGAEGWATLGKVKTKGSERLLPLHPLAARALRAWKAAGWAHFIGRQPNASDPVFPNDKGEAHRPASAGLLRADLAAADLPTLFRDKYPIDFHSLRRSFYTWLKAARVEGDTVRMLMGHSGGSVGERHYGAKELERMRAAVETIVLDLSMAQVFVLPVRAAGGSDRTPKTEGLTAVLTAGLTAARSKERGQSPMIPTERDTSLELATFGLGRVRESP